MTEITARIIDGKISAEKLRSALKAQVATMSITPGLAVVLVGENPASIVYVRGKEKACAEIGITSHVYRLPNHATAGEIHAMIDALNENPQVHGILIQLPLPAHLNTDEILEKVDPRKDVDGLHPVNLGHLMSGHRGLRPCTPLGVMALLKETLGDLSGLHAVVIGRSVLVGKPVAQLLLEANCTVTIAHSKTRDLPALCAQADILVAATGQPNMVKANWVKPGAVVIDIGITREEDKLVGDVDFKDVTRVAGAITPVPGGVGPMTIAYLLKNTIDAAQSFSALQQGTSLISRDS